MDINRALEDYLDSKGRAETTKKRYSQALAFVQDKVPLTNLDKDNIRHFLAELKREGYRSSSIRFYYKFLKTLCENVLDQTWPLKRKDYPADDQKPRKPTFSEETLNEMIKKITKSSIDNETLARFAVATIYAPRRVELADLASKKQINIGRGVIRIETKKHGEIRDQPIPGTIKKLLSSAKLTPISVAQMTILFRRMELACGIPHVKGFGFHAVRRRVVTSLKKAVKKNGGNKNDVYIFLRWKLPRTIMDEYDVTEQAEIEEEMVAVDEKVLAVHPFLKTWQTVADEKSKIGQNSMSTEEV